MLEATHSDGRWTVNINSSSLDLLLTCSRKAYYSLVLKLKAEDEAPALAFGSSIHKALEHWYSLPVEQRLLADSDRETAEGFAFGHGVDSEYSGALESCRQFALRAQSALGQLADNEMRSLPHGIRILRAYFKRYADDQLVVATDATGPIIEREVQFEMYADESLTINYFGTIDVVLQNTQSGLFFVTDHKTTYSLGSEFYQRCKPNHQYTGYVLAAQKCLGIDTSLMMINGIQTAKTKQEFARQITDRKAEDFAELTAAVVAKSREWIQSMERYHFDGNWQQAFPQSAPNPCTMFGGCNFRSICEVPVQLKASVIRSKWPSSDFG